MSNFMDEVAVQYWCQFCGAMPGQWCIVVRTGNKATWLHSPRTEPVRTAFAHGYDEGLADGRAEYERVMSRAS